MGRKYALLQGEHAVGRRRDRGALQAAGPVRPRADRSGVGRRRAGRQARHAGRLLGDRREADRLARTPMRCAARRWAWSGSWSRTGCGSSLPPIFAIVAMNAILRWRRRRRQTLCSRPPLLLPRPPESLSPRPGRAPRSDRRRADGRRAPDDLLQIVRRVEALGSFLDTEDGKNLLAGTKRAANILAAEEKKGTAHRRSRRSGAVPRGCREERCLRR